MTKLENMPVWMKLLVAPILGFAFVLFLPFIGFVLLLWAPVEKVMRRKRTKTI